MKKFAIQFILLISVIGIAFYFSRPGEFSLSLPFFPVISSTGTLVVNNQKIKVEIADTKEKRSKGLGGREALATGAGMLFTFQKPDKYAFWMKGLNFPLDFVYIRENKVVDLLQNIQKPEKDTADSALPIFLPKTEVDSVLEVPSGTIANLDIRLGDTVKLNK